MSSKWRLIKKRIYESFFRIELVGESEGGIKLAETVTLLTEEDMKKLYELIEARETVTLQMSKFVVSSEEHKRLTLLRAEIINGISKILKTNG